MFNTGSLRTWRKLEASVAEGRLHRWLVVPAVISMFIACGRGASPLWAIGLAPPLAALPFVAVASLTPTRSLSAPTGTAALNVIAWCAFVWSLLIAIVSFPYGAIAAVATAPLLRTSYGRPVRLAIMTMWLGLVGLVAVFPLAWLGVSPVELGIGSALLIAGGAVWMIAALRARPELELPIELPRAVVH